jgi:DNA-binding response OmpR family regulator
MEYVRRILVVGDDQAYSAAVLRHLRLEGFIVEAAYRSNEARLKIQEDDSCKAPFDLVIIHSVAQGSNYMDFLTWLQETQPGVSVILVSSYGHSDESLEVIRPALDDYASTPLTPQQMMDLINAVDRRRRCAWVHLKNGAVSVKRSPEASDI